MKGADAGFSRGQADCEEPAERTGEDVWRWPGGLLDKAGGGLKTALRKLCSGPGKRAEAQTLQASLATWLLASTRLRPAFGQLPGRSSFQMKI